MLYSLGFWDDAENFIYLKPGQIVFESAFTKKWPLPPAELQTLLAVIEDHVYDGDEAAQEIIDWGLVRRDIEKMPAAVHPCDSVFIRAKAI